MHDLSGILRQFRNLREFSSFMEELVEAADGQEIARGMNPNDKSKQEKSGQSAPKEGGPEASVSQTPTPEGDPPEEQPPAEGAIAPGGEGGGAEAPTIDPVAAPGSQVSVGKKVESKIHLAPKTKKLDVKSAEKTTVDTKPNITVDPRFL